MRLCSYMPMYILAIYHERFDFMSDSRFVWSAPKSLIVTLKTRALLEDRTASSIVTEAVELYLASAASATGLTGSTGATGSIEPTGYTSDFASAPVFKKPEKLWGRIVRK